MHYGMRTSTTFQELCRDAVLRSRCCSQEYGGVLRIGHDVTMMLACREALGNLDAALHDYKSVIIEQPNNKEAAQRVEELVKLTMQTLPAEQNGP